VQRFSHPNREVAFVLRKCKLMVDGGINGRRTASGNFLSVVMPAYNEGNKIRKNISESCAAFKEIGIPFEIIVVNDGSKDNTEDEIRVACLEHPEVTLVSYYANGGKGNALKAGFKATKGDIVTFVDSDLELHPRQLKRFFEEMKRFHADIVIGSKCHPESIIQYPAKRWILSRGYNLFIRSLFGLKLSDTQPGLKLFRREVLDKELPNVFVKRWAFDLELLVNSDIDEFIIVEAPLELHYTRENGGRIGVRDVFHIFQDTLGIFSRTRASRHRPNEQYQTIIRENPSNEEASPVIVGK
jgi:dolichol-phosphate mannosyltransferase